MGTTHYNLTQPLSTDRFNLQVWNDNLEQIDQRMYLNQTTTFNGATELVAGSVGNVPAPQTSDKEKFLKGDGTWAEVQGGGGGAGADEMTLDEYNALSTAQKNDGTIRFIPQNSSSGTETAVDMSSIGTPYRQSSMGITATSSTETTITFSGGTAIGCNFNYLNPIDVTNISSITFKATNGSCYGGGAQAQRSNWNLQIGLTSTAIGDQELYITAGDSRWAVVADMPLANHVYEETLDVSQLTGNYYLLVVAHGWNTVVEDITLHEGGAYPSQIKYMDKTYADNQGSGGSGGGSTFETVFAGSKSTSSWNSPLVFDEFDVTAYDIIRITAALDGDSYVWLLDTDIIPVKPANKLHILGEAYCDRDNTSFEMYVSSSHNLSVSKIEGLVEGTGSSMVHYSTTEHQVGTWIDGSDIYERTVVVSSAISQGNYATIISGENIDLLGINSDGCFLTRSNGQRWSIFGGYSGSGLLIYQETNGDIKLYNNSGVDFTNATITVTYLK